MKKWMVCLGCIAFIHSFSEAQDTICFKTGEKDAVTVISFAKKAINFILEDTSYSVNESRVNYIKYRDGKKYSFQDLATKYDSINKTAYKEQEQEDSANYLPIHISIGVGGSTLQADIDNNDNIPGVDYGPYFISQSPAYNVVIDYSFVKWLSIGIGAVYQSSMDNPSEQLQGVKMNMIDQNETEKITRYNYSARVLYHPLKHSALDVYAGVRVGESMWKEQITSNSQPAGTTIYTTDIPSSQTSFQVLAGLAVPLYHCIGIHLELGYGNPYIIEAGISFMFKP